MESNYTIYNVTNTVSSLLVQLRPLWSLYFPSGQTKKDYDVNKVWIRWLEFSALSRHGNQNHVGTFAVSFNNLTWIILSLFFQQKQFLLQQLKKWKIISPNFKSFTITLRMPDVRDMPVLWQNSPNASQPNSIFGKHYLLCTL